MKTEHWLIILAGVVLLFVLLRQKPAGDAKTFTGTASNPLEDIVKQGLTELEKLNLKPIGS